MTIKVAIDLQWEKWKLAIIAISLQIFWEKFYRNVSWVVLYQTYTFTKTLNLIGCQGYQKSKFLKKYIKNQLQSYMGDKAEFS